MFGFQWLARLRRNEKGNVLFIGAACMPLFLGAAGLGVDTVQLALWKRQIQRAADSAAIAGALTKTQDAALRTGVMNDLDEHISLDVEESEVPPLLGDPTILLGSFAAGELSTTQNCAERGVPNCFNEAVQVELAAQKMMPFMSIFTGKPNVVRARATAAIDPDGDYCLISLHNQNSPGISAGGNSNLDMGCGLATNARGASAINVFGSAEIDGSPAAAVGGISGQGKFTDGTEFQPYSSPVRDPFAGVKDPVLPQNCTQPLSVGKGFTDAAPKELYPSSGCYTSWDIDGVAHLNPGTYYVNNGLFDLKGKLTGDNVTIIFMGDNSDWKQNAQSILDISAPKDGVYKNIAIFRDRNAAVKQFKINGGAGIGVEGAIYGKTTDFWLGGNAEFTSNCLQIVARVIEFRGGGTIRNTCVDDGFDSLQRDVVRLVA
ncbi:MAG TPA: pilus assembly protein TadG-related protein [Allosphingosinicella sp.]|jgi:hypothetical protein